MLSDRRPILLANARIIDPSRDLDIMGDLLIADGVIREAKKGIGAAGVPEGTDVIDCRGKVDRPRPGRHARLYRRARRRAIARLSPRRARRRPPAASPPSSASPTPRPAIDDPATVDFVLRRARDTAIVHVHPMAAITKGLEGKEMTEIGLLKAAGAVAFTDGARSITNAQVMRRTLTYARDFDALIVHHTEDPDLTGDGVMNESEFAARLGLLGIPKRRRNRNARARHASRRADRRALSRRLDHLRGIARGAAPRQGCGAQCHRLGLDQPSDVERNRHRPLPHLLESVAAACAPKTTARRWSKRLASGLIDVVMSDHNPQDVETKRLPFAEAAAGAIGLETMLQRGLAAGAYRRRHSAGFAARNVDAAGGTARPCRRHVAPGAPADVIVIDTDVPWLVDPDELKSKCKNTPFDEARMTGRVVRTIVAGRTIYEAL